MAQQPASIGRRGYANHGRDWRRRRCLAVSRPARRCIDAFYYSGRGPQVDGRASVAARRATRCGAAATFSMAMKCYAYRPSSQAAGGRPCSTPRPPPSAFPLPIGSRVVARPRLLTFKPYPPPRASSTSSAARPRGSSGVDGLMDSPPRCELAPRGCSISARLLARAIGVGGCRPIKRPDAIRFSPIRRAGEKSAGRYRGGLIMLTLIFMPIRQARSRWPPPRRSSAIFRAKHRRPQPLRASRGSEAKRRRGRQPARRQLGAGVMAEDGQSTHED